MKKFFFSLIALLTLCLGYSQRVDLMPELDPLQPGDYFWILDPDNDPQSHKVFVSTFDDRYQLQDALLNSLSVLSDPGGDSLLFWDDSESTFKWLVLGTGLSIDGNVLNASDQITAEIIEDTVGAMFSGNTETLITATYQDSDGTIDLVVDNDLSNYNASGLSLTESQISDLDHYTDADISGTESAFTGWDKNASDDLNTEGVQDIAGAMASGNTESRITVTYQDGDGTMDYVVDNDLSNYNASGLSLTESQISDLDHYTDADISGTESAFTGWDKNASDDLNTEGVQDIAGAMASGNTESRITVTYQDGDGTMDYVVDNDLSNYNASGLSLTESQISDLDHYTDADISGSESAFTGWDKNASDDFSGSYNDLSDQPSHQPLDSDLTAIAGISTTGLLKRTGSGTASTITDNSTNWNTAYTDRLKWNGGATGLNASTGRTSLGLGSIATQAASNVAITGGAISGLSSLGVSGLTTISANIAEMIRLDRTANGDVDDTFGLGVSFNGSLDDYAWLGENSSNRSLQVYAGAGDNVLSLKSGAATFSGSLTAGAGSFTSLTSTDATISQSTPILLVTDPSTTAANLSLQANKVNIPTSTDGARIYTAAGTGDFAAGNRGDLLIHPRLSGTDRSVRMFSFDGTNVIETLTLNTLGANFSGTITQSEAAASGDEIATLDNTGKLKASGVLMSGILANGANSLTLIDAADDDSIKIDANDRSITFVKEGAETSPFDIFSNQNIRIGFTDATYDELQFFRSGTTHTLYHAVDKVLELNNGNAPSAAANQVSLWAEEVSSSSELKVIDEAGNVTTLSPHNFTKIPEGPSEEMAWSFYSERDGKYVNVDMLKLARLVEKLTGEKLVYTGSTN